MSDIKTFKWCIMYYSFVLKEKKWFEDNILPCLKLYSRSISPRSPSRHSSSPRSPSRHSKQKRCSPRKVCGIHTSIPDKINIEITLCHLHMKNLKNSTVYRLTDQGMEKSTIPKMSFSRTFNHLWKNYAPFDGFVYSGHSNGKEMRYVNKNVNHRVATLDELEKKFKQYNASLKAVCFDSCLMSNIDVMETVSPYCKYVLSSPGSHPNFSYLLTRSFYSCPSPCSPEQTETYLASIQEEFTNTFSHIKYTCSALFDSKPAKKFYNYMVHLEKNKQLYFPRSILESGGDLTTILNTSNLDDTIKEKVMTLFYDAVISRNCFRYVPFLQKDDEEAKISCVKRIM